MELRTPPSRPAFPVWQKYFVFMPAYFVALAIWYGANSQDNIGSFALLAVALLMVGVNRRNQMVSDEEYDEGVLEWQQQFKIKPPDTSFGRSFR